MALRDNINNSALIRSQVERVKDLGSGYKVRVKLRAGNRPRIETVFIGPQKNINRIPESVIIEYADVLSKVDRWLNDLETDMPRL